MKSKRAREAEEDVLRIDDSGDAPAEKKRKRSDDEAADQVKQKKVKNDKKGKKDKKKDYKETRKEKKDKRKNLQDLPEDDAGEEEEEVVGTAATADGSDAKKEKPALSKTSKSGNTSGPRQQVAKEAAEEEAEEEAQATAGSEKKKTNEQGDEKTKKKKKKRKGEEDKAITTDDGAKNAEAAPEKPARHIVFVGNLPFSATAASIEAHFSSLKPISVRCLKNKDDAKPCRGIAFVEFANVWSMRTCLDKFHHTVFEDGISAGRKINVELTAGGGGSTKFRKDKILQKNTKLDENRAKRIDKEKTAKKQGGDGKQRDSAAAEGIHPSRLARAPGLGH